VLTIVALTVLGLTVVALTVVPNCTASKSKRLLSLYAVGFSSEYPEIIFGSLAIPIAGCCENGNQYAFR
jgi:hypothetical protein